MYDSQTKPNLHFYPACATEHISLNPPASPRLSSGSGQVSITGTTLVKFPRVFVPRYRYHTTVLVHTFLCCLFYPSIDSPLPLKGPLYDTRVYAAWRVPQSSIPKRSSSVVEFLKDFYFLCLPVPLSSNAISRSPCPSLPYTGSCERTNLDPCCGSTHKLFAFEGAMINQLLVNL